MSLTTTAKVKTWLGVSGSGDDSLIATLILSMDAAVKQVLGGRIIESASYSQQFDGTATQELLLPHFPITALTNVWIDPDYDFEDGDLLVADDDYTYEAASGILFRLGAAWTAGIQNVKIAWTGGYGTVPADVEQAANMIVADWYMRHKQLKGGQNQNEMVGESIGGERTEHFVKEGTAWGIPSPALAILQRYRNAG